MYVWQFNTKVKKYQWKAYEANRQCEKDMDSTVRLSASDRVVMWRMRLPMNAASVWIALEGRTQKLDHFDW